MAGKGRRPGYVQLGITAAAVFILLGQIGFFDWLGRGARFLTFSVSGAIVHSWQATSDAISAHFTGVEAELERRRLSQENEKLKFALQLAENLAAENNALRDLLLFHGAYPVTTVAAARIAYEIRRTGNHAAWLKLPQQLAERREFEPAVAAVSALGVVGRIDTIENSWGRILKLADRGSIIDLVFAGTSLHAIGSGSGVPGVLNVTFVPRDSAITTSTAVFSGGLDGYFPPGLPVGWVEQVTTPVSGMYDTVQVRLHQPGNNLRYVWLLFGQGPVLQRP